MAATAEDSVTQGATSTSTGQRVSAETDDAAAEKVFELGPLRLSSPLQSHVSAPSTPQPPPPSSLSVAPPSPPPAWAIRSNTSSPMSTSSVTSGSILYSPEAALTIDSATIASQGENGYSSQNGVAEEWSSSVPSRKAAVVGGCPASFSEVHNRKIPKGTAPVLPAGRLHSGNRCRRAQRPARLRPLHPFAWLQWAVVCTCAVVVYLHAHAWVPLLRWIEATVLGTWEESWKSVIRECFLQVNRLFNGVSTWLLSLGDHGYRDKLRASWSTPHAWQSWWREERQSTLNAVIAKVQPSTPAEGVASPTGISANQSSTLQRASSSIRRNKSRSWHGLFRYIMRKDKKETVARRAPPPDLKTQLKESKRHSAMFEQPSGWGVSEVEKRTGLLEDIRLGMELAVTKSFNGARYILRWLMLVPPKSKKKQANSQSVVPTVSAINFVRDAGSVKHAFMHGSHSFPILEKVVQFKNGMSATLSPGAKIIQLAGYPIEQHTITTEDGYILTMERIPRLGAAKVVFFMHGILDTSLTWVSAGVTGSQAFAAWDAGFDVWLGNSRANPPRLHADPARKGSQYWHFTLNQLSIFDITAMMDHIHACKCAELGATGKIDVSSFGAQTFHDPPNVRRSNSDPCILEAKDTCSDDFSFKQQTSADQESKNKDEEATRRRRADCGQSSHLVDFDEDSNTEVEHLLTPSRQSNMYCPSSEEREAAILDEIEQSHCEHAFEHASSISLQHHRACSKENHLCKGDTASDSRNGCSANSSSYFPPTSVLPPSTQYKNQNEVSACQKNESHSKRGTQKEDPSPDKRGRSKKRRLGPIFPRSTNFSPHGHDSAVPCTMTHPGLEYPLPSYFEHTNSPEGTSSSYPNSNLPTCHSAQLLQTGTKQKRIIDASSSHGTLQHEEAFGMNGYGIRRSNSAGVLEGSANPCACLTCRPQRRTSQGKSNHCDEADQHLEPYHLQVVAHSLGGASMLIFLIMKYRARSPHRLRRLILLTPAGFHRKIPLIGQPFARALPTLFRFVQIFWRQAAGAFLIPTFLARLVAFKLMLDLNQMPSLGELARIFFRTVMSGDASEWDRALQMPHYTAQAMPAISLHQGIHLAQLAKTGKFQLYDYGNKQLNVQHYGQETPPDISEEYWRINIPVDILAGRKDGVIPKENTRVHFKKMKAAGVKTTYREFDFGHMDFTFSPKEELKYYVMSRLLKG